MLDGAPACDLGHRGQHPLPHHRLPPRVWILPALSPSLLLPLSPMLGSHTRKEAIGPSRETTLAGRTQAWQSKDLGFNADPATDALQSLEKDSHLWASVSPLRERESDTREAHFCPDVLEFCLAGCHLLEQRALFGEFPQAPYPSPSHYHPSVSHLRNQVEGCRSSPVAPCNPSHVFCPLPCKREGERSPPPYRATPRHATEPLVCKVGTMIPTSRGGGEASWHSHWTGLPMLSWLVGRIAFLSALSPMRSPICFVILPFLSPRAGSFDVAPTLCLCGKKKKKKKIRPRNGPEIQCLPRLKDTQPGAGRLWFSSENALYN